jgi:hypothetical protein
LINLGSLEIGFQGFSTLKEDISFDYCMDHGAYFEELVITFMVVYMREMIISYFVTMINFDLYYKIIKRKEKYFQRGWILGARDLDLMSYLRGDWIFLQLFLCFQFYYLFSRSNYWIL